MSNNISDDKKSNYFLLCIAIILISVLVFIIYQESLLGLFMYLFFLIGATLFYVALHFCRTNEYIGTLSLFTNGIFGYLMMMLTIFFGNFLKSSVTDTNPLPFTNSDPFIVFSDASPVIIAIIVSVVILIVIISILGFVYEIKYNSNEKFKEKKYAKYISIIFFALGLFLTFILSIIIDVLT